MIISVIVNYMNFKETIKFIQQENLTSIDKFIIVDNSSSNESYEKLLEIKSNRIHVIQSNKNGGYAFGNNIGIEYAKQFNPSFIILNNTDISISNDSIVDCMNLLTQNETYGVITPSMVNFKNEILDSAWKFPTYGSSILRSSMILSKLFRRRFFYTYSSAIHKVDCIQGSFMMFKSEALFKISPLLETQFLYGTEDYIGYSLYKAKYDVIVNYDDKYIHEHNYHKRTIKTELQHYKLLQQDRLNLLKHIYRLGTIRVLIFKTATFLGFIERSIILFILKMFRRNIK